MFYKYYEGFKTINQQRNAHSPYSETVPSNEPCWSSIILSSINLLSCCDVSAMHHTTSTDMVTKTLLRPVTADQSEQAELLRREA